MCIHHRTMLTMSRIGEWLTRRSAGSPEHAKLVQLPIVHARGATRRTLIRRSMAAAIDDPSCRS
jgi:hypothetical protein